MSFQTKSFAFLDPSSLVFIIHQTDSDGNWAGSRPSEDRNWNLHLLGDLLQYDTLSLAHYRLLLLQDRRLVLETVPPFDNIYSEAERRFIRKYIPPKAERE